MRNITVKELWKLVFICRSYDQKNKVAVFGTLCTHAAVKTLLPKFASAAKLRLLKAKFHYATWFEAGRRQVRSWSRWSPTSFEPASVMEFGFCWVGQAKWFRFRYTYTQTDVHTMMWWCAVHLLLLSSVWNARQRVTRRLHLNNQQVVSHRWREVTVQN